MKIIGCSFRFRIRLWWHFIQNPAIKLEVYGVILWYLAASQQTEEVDISRSRSISSRRWDYPIPGSTWSGWEIEIAMGVAEQTFKVIYNARRDVALTGLCFRTLFCGFLFVLAWKLVHEFEEWISSRILRCFLLYRIMQVTYRLLSQFSAVQWRPCQEARMNNRSEGRMAVYLSQLMEWWTENFYLLSLSLHVNTLS